jgi:hypothetical protein
MAKLRGRKDVTLLGVCGGTVCMAVCAVSNVKVQRRGHSEYWDSTKVSAQCVLRSTAVWAQCVLRE